LKNYKSYKNSVTILIWALHLWCEIPNVRQTTVPVLKPQLTFKINLI
jgi:hypothetical protein